MVILHLNLLELSKSYYLISFACSSLPWWTYIKVLIVGCLVTPHFEGSLYVYKHIVHPCLSIDLHVLLNELVNLMVVLKQEKVLAEAKNAKDTAGEALQNLTALKVCTQHPVPFLQNRLVNQNANAADH